MISASVAICSFMLVMSYNSVVVENVKKKIRTKKLDNVSGRMFIMSMGKVILI